MFMRSDLMGWNLVVMNKHDFRETNVFSLAEVSGA